MQVRAGRSRLGVADGDSSIAHARTAAATDWEQIIALYRALAQVAPSSGVELNRAVAVGMAFGPAAGLEIIDTLLRELTLARYHWLPSVRGDRLS